MATLFSPYSVPVRQSTEHQVIRSLQSPVTPHVRISRYNYSSLILVPLDNTINLNVSSEMKVEFVFDCHHF